MTENVTFHVAPAPRRFPHPLRIATIGHVLKLGRVSQAFRTFNFSLILSGTGDYSIDGRRYAVCAPCVITQWPGVHVDYGPTRNWEELYFIYDDACMPYLLESKLASMARSTWTFDSAQSIRDRLPELKRLAGASGVAGNADFLDRLCESFVLESLVTRTRTEPDERRLQIESIRQELEERADEDVDVLMLAREHGFSQPSFFRHWKRVVGVPPHRYLVQLRIQQACRLLTETDQPVGEIARASGFVDPLYFSRLFRRKAGMTASAYRRHYQAPLAGQEMV